MRRYVSIPNADKRGATAIDFGLIAALIAVVVVIGVQALETSLSRTLAAISHGF
jgi:pilus assembly protein Flp/PilA